MHKVNATYFAGASNMSLDQIQQLFSPVVPGCYANNLVFSPSTNPQDSIFHAIEVLRRENQPDSPQIKLPLAHG